MAAITAQRLEDCLRKGRNLAWFSSLLCFSTPQVFRFPSLSLQKPYKRVFWLSSSDLSLELASFHPSVLVSYSVKKVSRSGGMLLARAKFHGALCGNFA